MIQIIKKITDKLKKEYIEEEESIEIYDNGYLDNKKNKNKTNQKKVLDNDKNYIKIEKDEYYKIKNEEELKEGIKNLDLEDLFLDNSNFRKIFIINIKIFEECYNNLNNQLIINKSEVLKNNINSNLIYKNIETQCLDNIELINKNKLKLNSVLLNYLSSSNKKYLITKASGSYGKIYKSLVNKNILIKTCNLEETNLIDVYMEYVIQYLLNNYSNNIYKSNIPKVYCMKISKDLKTSRIYMENIEGLSLFDYLTKMNIDDTNIDKLINRVLNIIIKICDILIYLQNNFGFIHFDLHLGNILIGNKIDNKEKVYLIDFGFSSINFNRKNEINNQNNKDNQDNQDNIFIVNKSKNILYSKKDERNGIKTESIDMFNLMLRLMMYLKTRIKIYNNGNEKSSENKLYKKLFILLNQLFSFEKDIMKTKKLDINNSETFESETIFNLLYNNLKEKISLSYKYACNIYYLKNELNNKGIKNKDSLEHKLIEDIIDRFNPHQMKEIIHFFIFHKHQFW